MGLPIRLHGTSDEASMVGQKAAGLFPVPASWVPEFLVLTVQAVEMIETGLPDGWMRLEGASARILEVLEGLNRGPVIIRSSAVAEGLEERGKLVSKVVLDPGRCEQVAAQLVERNRRILDTAPVSNPLALMVQKYVKPLRRGHLSNERRVSERHDTWLVEELDADDQLLDSYRVAGNPARLGNKLPERILVSDGGGLRAAMRDLAASTSLLGERGRRHIEWVWDGQQVWLVQCDRDTTRAGDEPGSRWERPAVDLKPHVSLLVEAGETRGDWQKTECVREFQRLGLATAPLFVLEDQAEVEALCDGRVSSRLETDLRKLVEYPVVVRSDIARSMDDRKALMLRRTDTCTTLESVVGFLLQSSQVYVQRALSPGQFAFLLHRFIPARAGSYSLARPDTRRVRVDSTWGVPDGLLFNTHDSFEVDLADPSMLVQKKRCKDQFIDFEADGQWIERAGGTPWDWLPSLSGESVVEVAEQAFAVAQSVGRPVEVMHFIDVRRDTGLPPVLPWFFRPIEDPIDEVESAPGQFRNVRSVRNPEDLAAIATELELDGRSVGALSVRADCDYLRSDEFLEGVASVALKYELPIDMRGSLLAHASYLLRSAGVRVRASDPLRSAPASSVRTFDKLVRDEIPEKIVDGGEAAEVQAVQGARLTELLKLKAIEEVYELFDSVGDAEAVEEAADVIEVLRALVESLGMTVEELEQVVASKREARGGFSKGLVLKRTFVPPVVLGAVGDTLFDLRASPIDNVDRTHSMPIELSGRWVDIVVSRIPGEKASMQNIELPEFLNKASVEVWDFGQGFRVRIRPHSEGTKAMQLNLFDELQAPTSDGE